MKPRLSSIARTITRCIILLLIAAPAYSATAAFGEYELAPMQGTTGGQWRFAKMGDGIYYHRNTQSFNQYGLAMRKSEDEQSGIALSVSGNTGISAHIIVRTSKAKDEEAQIIIYQLSEEDYAKFDNPEAIEDKTTIDDLDLSKKVNVITHTVVANQSELDFYTDEIIVPQGYYYVRAIESLGSNSLVFNALVLSDGTCGPTLTKGQNAGWAGGRGYKVGDTPDLTFEIEATASNGGELTYTWFQYSNNDPSTAEVATGSTNSNTYTPPTDKPHSGYIYYCQVKEKGCAQIAQTAYTGTITVEKPANRAIADYLDEIGTIEAYGTATIKSSALNFPNNYLDKEGNAANYYEITPKDGYPTFVALDTIVYSSKISNASSEARLTIYNDKNEEIYTEENSSPADYAEQTIVLPADMAPTSTLRIGRLGATALQISDFKVYPYGDRTYVVEEPTLTIDVATDIDEYKATITITASKPTELYIADAIPQSLATSKTNSEIAAYIALKHIEDGDIMSYIGAGSVSKQIDLNDFTAGENYVICAFFIDMMTQTLKYEDQIQTYVYTIPVKEDKQEALYDITFKDNRKGEDAKTQLEDINDIIFSGADLVTNFSSNKYVYNASADHGIKLGKSESGGEISFDLISPKSLDKIEIYAARFKEEENTVIVNGQSITLNSDQIEKYEIDCNGETVSTITISSGSKTRCYVGGINLIEKNDEPSSDYDILFLSKTDTDASPANDATTTLTSTDIADYIQKGKSLVKSIDAKTFIYKAQQGYGLRLGNNTRNGYFKFSLTSKVKATSIIINTRGYTTSGTSLTINGKTITPTIPAKDFEIILDGSEIDAIEITSSKQVYIIGMTINGEKQEPVCEPTSETINQTATGSYTWDKIGVTYTESGIYEFKTTNDKGCEHTIWLNLTIEPEVEPCVPQETTIYETICEGETYDIDIYHLNKEGTYPIVTKDENGCDITTNVVLTVLKATYETINETATDSYTWDKTGATYTESGTYTYETTNNDGCKHTITLNLTIESSPEPCKNTEQTLDITICQGEEYRLGDQVLTTAGQYIAVLTSAQGCDSTVTINLTVNKPTSSTIEQEAKASFTWFGKVYTESGTYTYTTVNKAGCDSVITLNLTIVPIINDCEPTSAALNETICEGERFYVGSNSFNASGNYDIKLTNVAGCDSTIRLNLTVAKPTSKTITEVANDSYTWFGKTYTESGRYVQKLVNAAGCDSTIILDLTINKNTQPCEIKTSYINQTICEGETYWFNGSTPLRTAGEYNMTLKTKDGCDSIVVVTLTVNKRSYTTLNEKAIGSYFWDGQELTQSGKYTKTETNALGCDSIITLNLTIEQAPKPCTPQQSTVSISICEGEEYIIGGDRLSTSGTYTYDLTTADGCDSTVILTLTVVPTTYATVTHTAIGYYTWFGKLYTQSGQYSTRINNALGCDSIITLDLTVLTEDTVKPCAPISFSATSDNSEAGNVLIIQQPTCENENTAVASAEAKAGWVFAGWSDGSTESLRIIQLTEPTSLVAYFEQEIVPCTPYVLMVFNSNTEAGTVATLQQPNCDNGNQAIVVATSLDESKYIFSHWDDGSTDSQHAFTLTHNTAIIAYWTAVADTTTQPECQPYKLTINLSDPQAGAVRTLQSPTCDNNQTAIVQATTYAGYVFEGWEDGTTDLTRTIVLTGNTTITAYWNKEEEVCKSFTLTLRSDNEAHGTTQILQQPDCKTNQNTAVFEAIAASNYRFDQWSDGNKDNPRTLTLAANLTLYANFTILQFTVSATPSDASKGTVYGSGTYAYNSVVTLTATPTPGYGFTQWSDGVIANPRTITVTEDINLQAEFDEQYYHIFVSANDTAMGTVYGEGDYQAYTFATIEAEAKDGYSFVAWSDGNTQNVRNVLVLGTTAYQAVFTQPSAYKVEALSSNEAMGTVIGSGEYAGGTTVQLQAKAKQGYHFIRWQDDVTDNPRTITVSRDATYYAYFWLGTDLENNPLNDISIENMQILINGHEGETLGIWSATGQTIYNGTVKPIIDVPYHGIFLIQIGNQAAKIVL